MRRHHRATLLAVLLAVWAATGTSPGAQQDPPGSFPVPGYWEPVDGRTTRAFDIRDRNGLLWHQGFVAEGRPRWQWRPAAWVPAGDSRRRYRPGMWVPSDPQTRERYLAVISSRTFPPVSGKNLIFLDMEPGWKVGYSAATPGGPGITEFVRESDTIEHWQELVTLQKLPVESVVGDPRHVFERWKRHEDSQSGGKTLIRVLGEDAISILYEWRMPTAYGGWPAQHEISRWVFGPWTVYRIAYTVKRPEMPAEARQKWLKKISEALVVANWPPRPVGPKPGPAPMGGVPYNDRSNDSSAKQQDERAEAAGRAAIRRDPDDAEAHYRLGLALARQRKLEEAVGEFRVAIRLKPDYAEPHNDLGNALLDQGKPEEAVAEHRAAIRLKPDYADAHADLANALLDQGKLEETTAECREALRLRPDFAMAHNDLGDALFRQGKPEEAAAEYRAAIRLKPDYVEARFNLGHTLRQLGDYAGSLAEFRKGHDLGAGRPGWPFPSAQWVQEAEYLAALAERLPGVLRGSDRPRDDAECLVFGRLCYDTKRYAAAVRFWAEALAADSQPGADRRALLLEQAARAAALAAAGVGKDDPPPDDAAKAKLRGQALDWLKAERDLWAKLVESGPPQARAAVSKVLRHWKTDSDLACVRDADALAKLPQAERAAWRSLWDEVDALLGHAGDRR